MYIYVFFGSLHGYRVNPIPSKPARARVNKDRYLVTGFCTTIWATNKK